MATIERIIVGVDGSENSAEAVRMARTLALATGASVVAVHAVGLLDRVTPDEEPVISHDHRDEIAQRFQRDWCEPLADLDAEQRLEYGNPASVLLRVGREPGDLIIVGSRGAGGFPELTLGSTSAQVVHHARVPVVIVPLR